MGSRWRPNCIQVNKKHIKLDFLPPPVRGPFFEHFREKSGKEPLFFSMRNRSAYIFVALAACFSVTLFDLFRFLFLFWQRDCQKCVRIWLKSCKNALGSHLGAPWEALGAQNASRSEKKHEIGLPPPVWGPFLGHFRKESWKTSICFSSFFEAVTWMVFH